MARVVVPVPQANTFAVATGGAHAELNARVVLRIPIVTTYFKAPERTISTTTIVTTNVEAPARTTSTTISFQAVEQIRIPAATVSRWKRVAKLARIAIPENEIFELCIQLDSIMSFVEQLAEVNVEGVEPMTSVTPMALKMREDKVTDGGIADDIIANAPAHEHHFFVVSKVVE